MAKKARNPQDATLRNIRALKKRVSRLEAILDPPPVDHPDETSAMLHHAGSVVRQIAPDTVGPGNLWVKCIDTPHGTLSLSWRGREHLTVGDTNS